MNRLETMLDRLPPIYQVDEGSLLRDLLTHVTAQLETLDEDRVRVQRSHWVDTALDRDDLTKLGALLDQKPEPWESDDLFRDRLKALARARLAGAVAPEPLCRFVIDLLAAGRRRLGLELMPGHAPRTAADVPIAEGTSPNARAARELLLVEHPERLERATLPDGGRLRPFSKVSLKNTGLEPVPLQARLTGMRGGAAVPVLACLESRTLLGFRGKVPAGSHLRIVQDLASTRATLDGDDVTDRLFGVSGFEPGTSLAPADLVSPAPTLVLPRGPATLWFLDVGLYDAPAWDQVSFALAKLSRESGRFGSSAWNDAVFEMDAVVAADFWWRAARPASFEFRVPGATLLETPPLSGRSDEARERLVALTRRGLDELRAVGVESSLELCPSRSELAVTDRASVGLLRRLVEPGATPTTDQPDFAAILDVTALDRSRLE